MGRERIIYVWRHVNLATRTRCFSRSCSASCFPKRERGGEEKGGEREGERGKSMPPAFPRGPTHKRRARTPTGKKRKWGGRGGEGGGKTPSTLSVRNGFALHPISASPHYPRRRGEVKGGGEREREGGGGNKGIYLVARDGDAERRRSNASFLGCFYTAATGKKKEREKGRRDGGEEGVKLSLGCLLVHAHIYAPSYAFFITFLFFRHCAIVGGEKKKEKRKKKKKR